MGLEIALSKEAMLTTVALKMLQGLDKVTLLPAGGFLRVRSGDLYEAALSKLFLNVLIICSCLI